MMNQRSRWIALYVLCTGMLMIVLDVTVVNVALPYIQADLRFSIAGLAWVVNAYLIAFGGLLLLAGRLGDLSGRLRIFQLGLGIFTVSSAVCGLAPDQLTLVVARFVQGAGGALTSSVILGMIITMFTEPAEQAKAIGVFSFVAAAGSAVGLLAGGVLTQAINWHWIFFINVPIGIATAACARRWVPADEGIPVRNVLDVAGAVLITAALMLGVYTIVKPAAETGWASGRTLGFATISLALLVIFGFREAHAADPLVPLRIFRSRNLSGANAIQVLGAAGMYGSFFLGALYLQRVLHYGPLRIGLAFLPVSVLAAVFSVRFAAPLMTRFGSRRLCVAGLGLISAGLALFAFAPESGGYWLHLFGPLVILGVGGGIAFPPLMGLAMSGAAPQDAGLASGLVNTTAQVGGALGLAVFATLSSGRTGRLLEAGHSLPAALTGGYHLGFGIAALLVLCGVAVAAAALVNPVAGPPAGAMVSGDRDSLPGELDPNDVDPLAEATC
jgi:EmrB/QacA subfamily drug resistance transporter